MDLLKTIILGLSLAVSFAAFVYTFVTNKRRASQEQIDAIRLEIVSVRTKVEDVDAARARGVGEVRDRITRVEAEVENLPNHSQMADLTSNIQEVRGDVGGVRDMLGMLSQRIERIDNYLMNKDK